MEVADSFHMVADSALFPVSLVVRTGLRCAVEQTYLHGLGRIGAAVGDVPPGSRSVPPIPVLAESIHTVRWSMPWLSSTERCLWRQLMSQSHHYELYLAESTGCLWWSEPAMIVMW